MYHPHLLPAILVQRHCVVSVLFRRTHQRSSVKKPPRPVLENCPMIDRPNSPKGRNLVQFLIADHPFPSFVERLRVRRPVVRRCRAGQRVVFPDVEGVLVHARTFHADAVFTHPTPAIGCGFGCLWAFGSLAFFNSTVDQLPFNLGIQALGRFGRVWSWLCAVGEFDPSFVSVWVSLISWNSSSTPPTDSFRCQSIHRMYSSMSVSSHRDELPIFIGFGNRPRATRFSTVPCETVSLAATARLSRSFGSWSATGCLSGTRSVHPEVYVDVRAFLSQRRSVLEA